MLASRHMRREKASLPVDVRRSKTSLLKFPDNVTNGTRDEDPQERIRRVIAEVFVISRVGDDFDDSFIRVSELY